MVVSDGISERFLPDREQSEPTSKSLKAGADSGYSEIRSNI